MKRYNLSRIMKDAHRMYRCFIQEEWQDFRASVALGMACGQEPGGSQGREKREQLRKEEEARKHEEWAKQERFTSDKRL